MRTTILKQINKDFPFGWANLESYRDSAAFRKEIYVKESVHFIEDLKALFHSLFGFACERLIIYDKSWWDFCLDTWDFDTNEYSYDSEDLSPETKDYLALLKDSQITIGHSGCCTCQDWDRFLTVILRCIMTQRAPYSQLFCSVEDEYFFYFHETGSIGIYYKEENDAIAKILTTSHRKYLVKN